MDSAERWLLSKIVSGGQTGADRAALDWARLRGVDHGGWCPKGRLAADGPLLAHYQLRETESAGYRQRTKLNVRDSDATLVLNTGDLDGGTLQTVRFAQTLSKPHLVVQLDEVVQREVVHRVRAWLIDGQFNTLNVAGPRDEKRPGIYAAAASALDLCLKDRGGNRRAGSERTLIQLIKYSYSVLIDFMKSKTASSAPSYPLADLCVLADLPPRTVRYYVQIGLVDRPEGETRAARYGAAHLEQLLLVKKWTAAGLSLDRIRELLHGGQAPVPPRARAIGSVEVCSHLMVADGVDLVIEPGRAGLSPEQVRNFIKGVMAVFAQVGGGDAPAVAESQKQELKGQNDGPA